MLTLKLIREAAARIAGRVHRTPVVTSNSFNQVAGREVFFKCENLQRAGAFKIRGATNKIQSLTDDEKRRGVIAVPFIRKLRYDARKVIVKIHSSCKIALK